MQSKKILIVLALAMALFVLVQCQAEAPTPERLLETVERFEEDLTDDCRPYYPLRVKVSVGDAIPAGTTRERSAEDPVIAELERQLKEMLAIAEKLKIDN